MITPPPMLQPLIDSVRAPFSRTYETTRVTPARDWRLIVYKDRFTSAEHCEIVSRKLVYRAGVVTFRFGRSVDTANAIFRTDSDAARSVGDVAVEAAGKGAKFLTSNAINPSNGEVHIPAAQLDGHRTVAIRPNLKASVRTFSLEGLAPSLAAAAAHGCPVA
jgi:hypothetical protein